MNKATIIEELQRIAALPNRRSVSRSAFQKHATISSGVVEESFGSWNEAIIAARLRPCPKGDDLVDERRRLERLSSPTRAGLSGGRIPDTELLDELLRLAKVLGRRPSGNQIAAKGKYRPDAYQQGWGSVAAAYETALERKSE